jgi:hypothetical protein
VPLVNDDFATRQFLYPSLVRDVDLAGDYNGDGTVDAADYTAWRDHLGQLVSLPNETATFGSVTGEDYDVWLVNFGTSIPTGAAAGSANLTSAVPEPASLALLAWAAAWVWWRPPSSRVFNRGESSS